MKSAIQQLRELNMGVPKPPRLPSEAEVNDVEAVVGITLHPDFRKYLLEASDVNVGTLEPVTAVDPESHTYLLNVIEDAKRMGVPSELLPICEDNSDFYCINNEGQIIFWSHNGTTDEKWDSLSNWIQDVWINGG
jgi:hypothetical protein